MARPPRQLSTDTLYHVTARGVLRSRIYTDETDLHTFVAGLADSGTASRWRLHSYCLMPNHFHLLVDTPHANLDTAMHRLSGTYAARFNRRHARTGHVFEARYGAREVASESHLLEVVRYLPLNPVRAGLCRSPEEWRWSSHRALVGVEPVPPFLTTGRILDLFGETPDEAMREYARFVAEGMDRPVRERPPLESLLETPDGAAIRRASELFGYRQVEIARHLGVHPSTVLRRLRKTA